MSNIEKNTALISIEEYDELRKIKKMYDEDNFILTYEAPTIYGRSTNTIKLKNGSSELKQALAEMEQKFQTSIDKYVRDLVDRARRFDERNGELGRYCVQLEKRNLWQRIFNLGIKDK